MLNSPPCHHGWLKTSDPANISDYDYCTIIYIEWHIHTHVQFLVTETVNLAHKPPPIKQPYTHLL